MRPITTSTTAGHEDLRQAAEWFAVLQSGSTSDADRRGWQRWLDSGPGPQAAWRRVESLADGFARLSALPTSQALEHRARLGRARRNLLRTLALVPAGGLACWLAGEMAGQRGWMAAHQTRVGERREIQLADGGRLWLNTNSAADIDYRPDLRRIVLYRGELLLTTGHDQAAPARPMVVDLAHARLQALGTRFAVRYEDGGAVRLTVLEGRVSARPEAGDAFVVPAGHQARVWPHRVESLGNVPAHADGWTRGLLVVDRMRLADFLGELSRYRHGLLTCAPEVGDLRIVGAYPLDDADRVLEALATTLAVRVRRPLPWWVALDAAPQETR